MALVVDLAAGKDQAGEWTVAVWFLPDGEIRIVHREEYCGTWYTANEVLLDAETTKRLVEAIEEYRP